MQMELVAGITLWGLGAGWLMAPYLGLPRILARATAGLLVAEFVALLTWSYGSAQCAQRPCSELAETARQAAALDVPLLALAVLVLAVAHGLRSVRADRRGRTPSRF